MNITYTQNGDYLIPNIIIRKTKPLGHYGRLRKAYLEMHRPILFNELVLSDRLFEHCAEIVGVFNLEGVVDEESKKDAHVQCYDQLFPFLQSTITQLTTASGMPGFLMRKNPMKRENITFAKGGAPKEDKPEQPMTLPIV